jgi:hypothetical protein
MDKIQAFQILANDIWKKGEGGELCLVPRGFDVHMSETLHDVADFLSSEMGATHYSRKWEEKGKSVQICLFQADAFGAAPVPQKPIHTEIVTV